MDSRGYGSRGGGSVAGQLALEKGEGWHVRSRGYGPWVSVSAVAMSVSAWHPRLPPVGAEACTPEQVEEGSSPASSLDRIFASIEGVCRKKKAGLAGQATEALSVSRTSSDLAAVAARSDEGMWAGPTRPRVEPGSAHGMDRSSDPSPLFHVVAVAILAAVVSGDSGRSCGVTLPLVRIGVTFVARVREKCRRQRQRQRQRQRR